METHTATNIPISTTSDAEIKTPCKLKRKRSNSRQRNAEDIPWTAARCNRLLRTIASRIHILRRLSENDFAEQAARTPKAKRKRDFSVIDPVERLESKFAVLETPSRADDPEWFPTEEKKMVARTYGGRVARMQKGRKEGRVAATESAEARFRTPLIKKILRPEAADSPLDDAYSTSSRIGQSAKKGRQDSIQPRTHAERALKTLLDAFDSLLVSTKPSVPAPKRGASSLMSMCLRQIPQYIDFEQDWAEEEEGNYNFDATKAVYADLEDLGTGEGWQGLREVVRAHAVKMILDAMADRMWPLQSLNRLLDSCIRNDARKESLKILGVWFVCAKGKIEDRLEKLFQCCKKLDAFGFSFRVLKEQMEHGSLTLEELSSCSELWDRLIEPLSRRSTQSDAAAFWEHYVLACLRAACDSVPGMDSGKTRRESLLHITTVLVTVVSVQSLSHKPEDPKRTSLSEHLFRVAVSAVRKCEQVESARGARVPTAASAIVEKALISGLVPQVSCNADPATSGIALSRLLHMFADMDGPGHFSKMLMAARAEFVIETAKCINLIDQPAAKDFIKNVTTELLRAANEVSEISGNRRAARFAKDFAVAVAMVWAEHRSENEWYAFAEKIEKAASVDLSPRGGAARTPESAQRRRRFRWEDGIGEWIAATPAADDTVPRNLTKAASKTSQDSRSESRELEAMSTKADVDMVALSAAMTKNPTLDIGKDTKATKTIQVLSPPKTPTPQAVSQEKKEQPRTPLGCISPNVERTSGVKVKLVDSSTRTAQRYKKSPKRPSQKKTPKAEGSASSPTKAATETKQAYTANFDSSGGGPAHQPHQLSNIDVIPQDELAPTPSIRPKSTPARKRQRSGKKSAHKKVVAERDELSMTPAQPPKEALTPCPAQTEKKHGQPKRSKKQSAPAMEVLVFEDNAEVEDRGKFPFEHPRRRGAPRI